MRIPLLSLSLAAALGAAHPAARADDPAATPAPAPGAPTTQGPVAPAPAAPPRPSRTVTLAQAMADALAHQPTLLQAHAGSEAAGARADEAESSLLPQLNASGTYARATNNIPGTTSALGYQAGTTWGGANSWRVGATLSQLIWDFGQTSGKWRAAQSSAESLRDTEDATRAGVLLGVETAFFGARAGKDLVRVARDNLANQGAHLRQTEGFVRAGTHAQIDLAQARTDYANAVVQVVNAENSYLTEKAQLNQAMGLVGPTDYEVADDTLPPVEGEDLTLEALMPQALAARPEIAALDAQTRVQERTLGSVKAGYLPALGLAAGLNDSGPALDSTVWNWSTQLTLSWNVYQGGLTSAQVRETQANLDAARAQLETQRQQVRVDVETARLAVRAAKQTLSAAGDALANARVLLQLAEGRYRTGVGNAIELGDAQVALTTAAAQQVQAEYNLSTSRGQLLRALGRMPQ